LLLPVDQSESVLTRQRIPLLHYSNTAEPHAVLSALQAEPQIRLADARPNVRTKGDFPRAG